MPLICFSIRSRLGMSESRQEPGVLRVLLDRLARFLEAVLLGRARRRVLRDGRPPASPGEVAADETEQPTHQKRDSRPAQAGRSPHGFSSLSSSRTAFQTPAPLTPSPNVVASQVPAIEPASLATLP